MRTSIAFHFLTAAASIAFAADTSQVQCKYDGTQQEMNACAVKDHHIADDLLNKTYKQVMSSLSESNQNAVLAQQRAWLKTRDSKCREEAKDSEGGSIWPLDYYGCLEKVTKQRTKELQAWKAK